MPLLNASSHKLIDDICEAYGIPPESVARIVVDIPVGNFTMVYVQLVGDEKLLSVEWSQASPRIRYTSKDNDDA